MTGFDSRLGLEGHRTAMLGDSITANLAARAGVLAQLSGGSASVPVSFGGQSFSVVTPGANALGFYAGGGIDAALTERTTLTLDADASFRSDGRAGLTARAGFSGSF